MSEKEYLYNTVTGEYAVTFLTKNASGDDIWVLSVMGGTIETDAAYELSDTNEWVQVTKDNADLFIDSVQEDISELKQDIEKQNKLLIFLEGILDN